MFRSGSNVGMVVSNTLVDGTELLEATRSETVLARTVYRADQQSHCAE